MSSANPTPPFFPTPPTTYSSYKNNNNGFAGSFALHLFNECTIYRYRCMHIRIHCTVHIHARLKYIHCCIGILYTIYLQVWLSAHMYIVYRLSAILRLSPRIINFFFYILNLISDDCVNYLIILLYLIEERKWCVTNVSLLGSHEMIFILLVCSVGLILEN
jgi:hypothetical protein